MRKQRNVFQTNEQDKMPEKILNERDQKSVWGKELSQGGL